MSTHYLRIVVLGLLAGALAGLAGCDTNSENNAAAYNEQRARSRMSGYSQATALPTTGPADRSTTGNLSGMGTTSLNGATGGSIAAPGSSGAGAGGTGGSGGVGGGE